MEILENLKVFAEKDLAPAVKAYLARREDEMRRRHLEDHGGVGACRAYTSVIDGLLKTLFEMKRKELAPSSTVTLAAVGGYGRGELNMRSDIDLILLYEKKITPSIENLTQGLLYTLWDTGLDLGFSIRTVEETVELAKGDTKTMTALLDMRFLLGDAGLYERLGASVRKKLFTRRRTEAFIGEKLEETRLRHEKYGGSVYILEPNVKEGEGGLRDLHTARWVIMARDGRSVEPFELGLLSERDGVVLKDSLDFILWVRNELHLATGRKTDQLSFDHQERIARLLGFKGAPDSLPVEAFMQTYYSHASNINRYSNLLLSRYLKKEERSLWPRKKIRVDEDFFVEDGRLLAIRGAKEEPIKALRAFELSGDYGASLDQSAKDLVLNALERVDEGFVSSPEARASFRRILRGRNVFEALGEMHRLNLLERLIPEFSAVTCRTQHDLYHIYTVDVHTLFAVRELERLRDAYKFDFPILSNIYEELERPELLILAVLLHDIGKAHGKGHAEKGATLVPGICRRLGFGDDDTELVSFLVRNHLLLADTAQYRDLHDERLIVDFAKSVADMERLNLLYLLTFADVRAVGPEVWSRWKGALFQELYFKTLTVLDRGDFEIEEAHEKVERIRRRVGELVLPEGVSKAVVGDFFELLPQRYFLSTAPEFIAEHIKILMGFTGEGPATVRVRQDEERHYTEIIVCTYDIHGLFSMIAGVMTANGVDILGAQINTTKNGIALDILQVTSPAGELITDEYKLKKIETDLTNAITGKAKVGDLVGRYRKPSILDKKPKPRVPTRVEVDNQVSDAYTVLDIKTQNRIGLLYDITSTLSSLGLFIYISKISTKGDEAADIFYVKDIFGQKVYYEGKLKEIKEALYNVLSDKKEARGAQ